MMSDTSLTSDSRGQQPSRQHPVQFFSNNIQDEASNGLTEIPGLDLPKGGGAIKGIEEKFQVNAVTGTSSFGIPIPLSPSRQGFIPAVGLTYNSAGDNSAFGLGWQLGLPSITRKTEKKLPEYKDAEESDTFILSGIEDLVPLLEKQGTTWKRYSENKTINGISFVVQRYRPRIEGLLARIEKWTNPSDGDVYWKTITKNNIHTWYGLTDQSRVSDPADTSRIFQWTICRTHDDKGNITIYHYKKEDFKNIPDVLYEKNRKATCTQLYIKEIWYGNKKPWYLNDPLPAKKDFMFHLVFDYGEHDQSAAIPKDIDQEKNSWPVRKDPYSNYRPGFELRTYRRCQRVLVFHCFDELPHSPFLVRSLQLFYDDEAKMNGNTQTLKGFSLLTRARQNGHVWDQASNTYNTKSIPEIELKYQPHMWQQEVKLVGPRDLVHSPVGVDNKSWLWVDLYNEGITGILTEQANGWYYKHNLGKAEFSEAKLVAPKPGFIGLSRGTVSVQQLEGNGIKYLVHYDKEPKGFFKLDEDDQWQPFTAFHSMPNLDFKNPNLRSIDLDGDAVSDLLITEDDGLRWYKGMGEQGFTVSEKLVREFDEEKGLAILFADSTQSIFLADMNGDGLTDIVRIRNAEVCYWPNLGYGRFGARINMKQAPTFDYHGSFQPSLLRLADIDGSGTIDIIYLGKNDFRVWMNLNGNEWSPEPIIIPAFPEIHQFSDVSVLDFLGTGTACIVYSSPLSKQPFQYIDLMGSKKPHLFTGFINNCGKEVTITYKSSTQFYLDDKKKGIPWITKLPFPVHCIAEVRNEDKIRNTVFINSFSYRHGYFDFDEREFRGFARVEQWDTLDFSHFKLNAAKNVVEEALHQPPVKIVSWFHTGAYLRHRKIVHQCQHEYFQNSLFDEYQIPEPLITEDIPAAEIKEAFRTLKGTLLRTEVYAEDHSSLANYPYTASGSAFEIRRIQPRGENKYASFQVIPSESISYKYERNPADPRITHNITIEADELGYVRKSVEIIYPRVNRPVGPHAIPDKVWEEQNRLHLMYGELQHTPDFINDSVYRLRTVYEGSSYELGGFTQPAGFFFKKKDLAGDIAGASDVLFENDFTGGFQKRLYRKTRVYYQNDDCTATLSLGTIDSRAICFKFYQLALTKGLVAKHYQSKLNDTLLLNAGYVHLEGDQDWWIPSGTPVFTASPQNDFFIPAGYRDNFNNISHIKHDAYKLLVQSTTNALGHVTTANNDYRILKPVVLTDPNGNQSAIETDELGFVIKSAIMGKPGAGEGDILADPTGTMTYDLFNWKNNGKPNYVHMMVREKHRDPQTRWQENYLYSDGGGRVVMTKVKVEPGKARSWNPVTKKVEEKNANPRWVGNGRTIINNKDRAVKQFDPYFSTTPEFESEDMLVETGFTKILYYDPIGRNIRTEIPNGTYSTIEFDPWQFKSFDLNDTVKQSQWYTDRGSPDPTAIAEPNDPETRAAWLTAKHDNTPKTTFTDSVGRAFYTLSDYGNGKTTSICTENDFAVRYSKVYDQLQRNVASAYFDLVGNNMYTHTSEKGERWVFTDVLGRLVKIWDNNIQEMRMTFDQIHRPVSSYVKRGNNEILSGRIVYGDLLPNAEQKNLKGRTYQIYDQAGVVVMDEVDFKGNVTQVSRKLCKQYKQDVNWIALEGLTSVVAIDATAASLLETENFQSFVMVDALNRPVVVVLPDSSVIEPKYNEGNFLESLRVQVHGTGNFTTFLQSQDYDAKGQRLRLNLGNGLTTSYFYDPFTFRLERMMTKLDTDSENKSLQNLFYTYDPVGNVVYTKDEAQQQRYFQNAVVKPECKYEYDALYQLARATGRELAGLGADTQRTHNDQPFVPQLPHVNDLNAVRNYTEIYTYDDLGNIKNIRHLANGANWKQNFQYQYEVSPGNTTNRLAATSLPNDPDGVFSGNYTHDLHGNITSMPHLSAPDSLRWNFMDQLREVDLGGGGMAYYRYNAGGSRIRKIIERNGTKTERIYLGSVEIYRESPINKPIEFERYTLHVSDNIGRIAQVDVKTLDKNQSDPANLLNDKVIRYQYGNHLGSGLLETDKDGVIISYEEYHPFGTSSYRSHKPGVDLSLKRYRFNGKEHDEETGFYYYGARYYAAWIGRWLSCDPAGFVDGINLYRYCLNNPVLFADPSGTQVQNLGRTDVNNEQISKAKKTNTDDARAIIDKAYPVGTIVKNQAGDQLKVIGGSFWNGSENILNAEKVSAGKGGRISNKDGSGQGGEGKGEGGGKKKGTGKGDGSGGGGTGDGGKGQNTGTGSGTGTGTGTKTGGGGGEGGTGKEGGGGKGGEGGSEEGDENGTDTGTGSGSGSGSGNGGGSGSGNGGGSGSGNGSGSGSGNAGSGAQGQGGTGSGSGTGNGGTGEGGGGGGTEEPWIKSPFLRGLVAGIVVTLLIVAVVLTAGAILAAVAPAAAAALAGSATVAAIGTGLEIAGTAFFVANTVQSLRQRDIWNNEISADDAEYNLGFGLGGMLGGEAVGALSKVGTAAAEGEAAIAGLAPTAGNTTVYQAIGPNGEVVYVGITNNIARRAAAHLRAKGISISPVPGLSNISRAEARAVEQVLIEAHGLGKNGGTLLNKINSIATSNPIYQSAVQQGRQILQYVGYPGF